MSQTQDGPGAEHPPVSLDLRGWSIVSCGTLRRELERLRDTGFLMVDRILYTAPGLHEKPEELQTQLTRQLQRAKAASERVIVVYGSRCYIDMADPSRTIDALIRQAGDHVVRVDASNCIDMLADAEHRTLIQDGGRAYWLTPGWVEHWKQIFKDWDAAMANETFPQHDKAVVLDGLGRFEELALNRPEQVLELADWMKIPLEPCPVSLERLRGLLVEACERLRQDRTESCPESEGPSERNGEVSQDMGVLRSRVDELEMELAQALASRPAHDTAGLAAMKILQLEEDLEEAREELACAVSTSSDRNAAGDSR
jgi:uncharacterized protein DUF1638